MRKSIGNLVTNGVLLEMHEFKVINYLLVLGKDIELIPPSKVPGSRSPDFIMDDLEWEMKSLTKLRRRTMERAFRSAQSQSTNLIFDLRQAQTDDSYQGVAYLHNMFKKSKIAKRMLIITRRKLPLEFSKHCGIIPIIKQRPPE